MTRPLIRSHAKSCKSQYFTPAPLHCIPATDQQKKKKKKRNRQSTVILCRLPVQLSASTFLPLRFSCRSSRADQLNEPAIGSSRNYRQWQMAQRALKENFEILVLGQSARMPDCNQIISSRSLDLVQTMHSISILNYQYTDNALKKKLCRSSVVQQYCWWFIKNPRVAVRAMAQYDKDVQFTVSYCQLPFLFLLVVSIQW